MIETLVWDGPTSIVIGLTSGDFDPRYAGSEIALAAEADSSENTRGNLTVKNDAHSCHKS